MFVRYALVVGLLMPMCSNAASLCKQKFSILAKSPGSPSIVAYQEELTGECEQYRLHLVFLHDDIVTNMSRSGLDDPPIFVLDYFGTLGREESVSLNDSSGVYWINDSVWFKAPEFDSTFDERWSAFVASGGRDEHSWCVENREDCWYFPVFSGADPVLVHRYSGGLYKNYSIDAVTYFPASGTIIIITRQPRLKVGLDTMHGLLIYRLVPQFDQ